MSLEQDKTAWANLMDDSPLKPPTSVASYKAKSRESQVSEDSLRESDYEDIEKAKRSYDRYREKMGLSPRPNKTPENKRKRHVRRGRSPTKKRHYRNRSYTNEFGRHIPRMRYIRSQSKKSPKHKTPTNYTVKNGQIVNEFGRNYHYQRPKKVRGIRYFNEKTRKYKRPIHVFDEITRKYVPMNK
jgi:hypothetical protein